MHLFKGGVQYIHMYVCVDSDRLSQTSDALLIKTENQD
jgi:hypothetical protein